MAIIDGVGARIEDGGVNRRHRVARIIPRVPIELVLEDQVEGTVDVEVVGITSDYAGR